jgi:hypothetical protein
MRTWADDHAKDTRAAIPLRGKRCKVSFKGKMKGDYQKWLVQGICPKCARRDIEPGRSACATCLGYCAKYIRKARKKHKAKFQAEARARYQAKKALKPPKGHIPCPDEAPTVTEPTREWLEARLAALLHRA